MLTKDEMLGVLRRTGAVLEGHFLLTSGRHAARYVQCARLFEHPDDSQTLCSALAELFKDEQIDLVVGPALGAVLISYETARALKVRNFFTERDNGVMCLRRGFQIPVGARVLIVEDVVTTGGSVKEVIEVVRAHGGNPVAVGVIVDRSGGRADFGIPYKALLSMEVPSFEDSECPICKEGQIELVKPGSRAVK